MLNIRLIPLNPTVGALELNTKNIISHIEQAQKDGIELIVFPELCVCGYPPMDLLTRLDFLEDIYQKQNIIAQHCQKVTAVFGGISHHQHRILYNSGIVASNGQITSLFHKTLIPSYTIFDEKRHFTSKPKPNMPFSLAGLRIGVAICEDMWYYDPETRPKYTQNPIEDVLKQSIHLLIVISASPYTHHKPQKRITIIENICKQHHISVLFCNQLGGQTEFIFDGQCVAYSKQGKLLKDTKLFNPSPLDIVYHHNTEHKPIRPTYKDKNALTFEALKMGIHDMFNKTPQAKKIYIGLSGGIDSALTTCLAVESLGPKYVENVWMPSMYNSKQSMNDCYEITKNLNITIRTISIDNLYKETKDSIKSYFEGIGPNVSTTFQNIQARLRCMLLHAFANNYDGLVLNTTNKSELAMGYGTMYGDLSGGLCVLADLYKTEIYELAHWLNKQYYKNPIIPLSILTKEPSAELQPNQKDTDTLPPYHVLDSILYQYIEENMPKEKIKVAKDNEKWCQHIISSIHKTQFKRYQAPPMLILSKRPLGLGWHYPVINYWT